jgi:hypothetical protein
MRYWESTVRAYVRIRKAELDVAEQQTSSQAAAAWMMEVLHSDAALASTSVNAPETMFPIRVSSSQTVAPGLSIRNPKQRAVR